jgi:hypothetical protein
VSSGQATHRCWSCPPRKRLAGALSPSLLGERARLEGHHGQRACLGEHDQGLCPTSYCRIRYLQPTNLTGWASSLVHQGMTAGHAAHSILQTATGRVAMRLRGAHVKCFAGLHPLQGHDRN